MVLDRDELRGALESTAQNTGFSPMLIEKDYYGSLLLMSLYEAKTGAVASLGRGRGGWGRGESGRYVALAQGAW